jgi:aminopeptidase N
VKTVTIFLFILLSLNIFPQSIPGYYPFKHIDVIDYQIELDLTESFRQRDNSLKGSVSILASVDTISLSRVVLDAVSLEIDTVFVDGKKAEFSYSGKYLEILLPESKNAMDKINIKIFYQRKAQSSAGFYFHKERQGYDEKDAAFTASWPANTRNWLPCKDWPDDKAFVQISVKVPSGKYVVANGSLIQKQIENEVSVFTWKDDNPMATYVITVAASEFVYQEKKIARYSDPADTVTLRFYAYESNSERFAAAFSSVPDIINFYSETFSEYPFKDLSIVLVPGLSYSALSNQTIIFFKGIPLYFTTGIIEHEIAHQWFGNYINSSDWNLWMTEGLAVYASILYREKGDEGFYKKMMQLYSGIFLEHDTTSISDGSTLKLMPVLDMLRNITGDSLYWKSFKKFLKNSEYGSASLQDFTNAFNSVTGTNLDWFMDQWFNKTGYPVYKVSWEVKKIFGYYYVFIKTEQIQETGGLFSLPLKFTFYLDGSDTTHTFLNNNKSFYSEFRFKSEPLSVIVDKDSLFLLKKVIYENDSPTVVYSFSLEQNFPNPFNSVTKIEYRIGVKSFVNIKVYDIKGGEVTTLVGEVKSPGIYETEFDAAGLASGIYFYRMQAGEAVSTQKMILMK